MRLTLKELKELVKQAETLEMSEDSPVIVRNPCWPVPNEKLNTPYLHGKSISLRNKTTSYWDEYLNPKHPDTIVIQLCEI